MSWDAMGMSLVAWGLTHMLGIPMSTGTLTDQLTYPEAVLEGSRLSRCFGTVRGCVQAGFGVQDCASWLGPQTSEPKHAVRGGYGSTLENFWHEYRSLKMAATRTAQMHRTRSEGS